MHANQFTSQVNRTKSNIRRGVEIRARVTPTRAFVSEGPLRHSALVQVIREGHLWWLERPCPKGERAARWNGERGRHARYPGERRAYLRDAPRLGWGECLQAETSGGPNYCADITMDLLLVFFLSYHRIARDIIQITLVCNSDCIGIFIMSFLPPKITNTKGFLVFHWSKKARKRKEVENNN